jgi:hypothetical protein
LPKGRKLFEKMKKITALFFILLLFANCENAPKTIGKPTPIYSVQDTIAAKEAISHWTTEEPKKVSRIVETDTIIKAFGERFKMAWFEDMNAYHSGVMRFSNVKNKKYIAQDTLEIDFGLLLEREDYNKDGVKDILIHARSGGRGANTFYYLYLSDKMKKTFHFIKGFDAEPTPESDTSGMVIYHAYSGFGSTMDSRFYKIMPDYTIKEVCKSVQMKDAYVNTPEDLKQLKKDEKAYRKAYNKAWAAFKKM